MFVSIRHQMRKPVTYQIEAENARAARKIRMALERLDIPVILWEHETLSNGKVNIEYTVEG